MVKKVKPVRANSLHKGIINYERELRVSGKVKLTQKVQISKSNDNWINGSIIICDKNRSLVGTLLFSEEEGKGGKSIHLSHIRIEPGHRGQKLFVQLLSEITHIAKTHKIKALNLWVDEGNSCAREVYAKAGFTEIERKLPGIESDAGTKIKLELKL
jgi:GNAT superfamily N-acetyltransferase